MMPLLPFERVQTAAALLPSPDRLICGAMAFCDASDSVVASLQVAALPLMLAEALWITVLVPSEMDQTAVALSPFADRLISSAFACVVVVSNKVTGFPQVGVLPLKVAERLWMTCRKPFQTDHTAVAMAPSVERTIWATVSG